jgi:hypothetical protein
VESIEDLMMADVQEQKDASDNETSAQKVKSAKESVSMLLRVILEVDRQRIPARMVIATRVRD